MKKYTLGANIRTVIGKKVKTLRKSGLIPGNVYGKHIKSTSVSLKDDEFSRVFKTAGTTGLVELQLDGEKRSVLIQNIQLHPVTRLPLHVDLYQVDLKEKVKAVVPIEFLGSASAVEQKLGVLLTPVDEIEVEALPADLPDKISVDITKLTLVGHAIKVADLKLPAGVVALSAADTEVVKIGELITKEAEALAKEEDAAKAAQEAASVAEAAPAVEEKPVVTKVEPKAENPAK